MRSFGESPFCMKFEIGLVRSGSSEEVRATWPSGPAMSLYLACAVSCADFSCDWTAWIESVRLDACWTSACLADSLSGVLTRSDQESQNFEISALTPVALGSLSAWRS